MLFRSERVGLGASSSPSAAPDESQAPVPTPSSKPAPTQTPGASLPPGEAPPQGGGFDAAPLIKAAKALAAAAGAAALLWLGQRLPKRLRAMILTSSFLFIPADNEPGGCLQTFGVSFPLLPFRQSNFCSSLK